MGASSSLIMKLGAAVLCSLMADGIEEPHKFSGRWLDKSVAERAPELPQVGKKDKGDCP